MVKYLFLFITLVLYYPILFAQKGTLTQTLKGTITDNQSGIVLQGVTVTVMGTQQNIAAITDSIGGFKINNIAVGRVTVIATMVGYGNAVLSNIEVTSSKEVVLEMQLKEQIKKLDAVTIKAAKQKNKAINEVAVVSARQFSVEEAVRYAGTRNDPSRMAQNFAGVGGTNDARNDIVIRGNSPSGVLWRMDGIDIPNPNHFSTLGSTGGPVSMLNTNTLKNADFITSAFPAQYGNAVAGVFDLRMRNGNTEKNEYTGQAGFNGFEFGAEGPLNKKSKSAFLVNYRYSLIAAIQSIGLSVGTGSATPYYQDATFKIHLPTKKWGTFDWFGLGGKSHIAFDAFDNDNLYSTNDGSFRNRNFTSLTGVTGITNTYFFNKNTSGKLILAAAGIQSIYKETIVAQGKPNQVGYDKKNVQIKYTIGYTFNKKINSKNQITTGITADINQLRLKQDYIPDGDSIITTFVDIHKSALLIRAFANYNYRYTDKLSTNIGAYYQQFTINNSYSIEPRWNIKYQIKINQSISFGAGVHSQLQPLEVYFYQTKNQNGQIELTNKNLGFVKSIHTALGYDINITKQVRIKAEVYAQYIYNAAVEKTASSFSLINSGADFYFPDKTNLLNKGKGYNYGIEFTLERFLHNGFYYLFTASAFQSKYKASDNIWRSTAFNTQFVNNALVGKSFGINTNTSFGIDTKISIAGGQLYTPFDITTSQNVGYIVFKENEAYSLRNNMYWRWDVKFSYSRNGKYTTQKWYIDLQNITNNKNIYLRTLQPKTGTTGQINQIGFFPNFNYQITF